MPISDIAAPLCAFSVGLCQVRASLRHPCHRGSWISCCGPLACYLPPAPCYDERAPLDGPVCCSGHADACGSSSSSSRGALPGWAVVASTAGSLALYGALTERDVSLADAAPLPPVRPASLASSSADRVPALNGAGYRAAPPGTSGSANFEGTCPRNASQLS